MGCLSELLGYLSVRALKNKGESPESRNYVYRAGNQYRLSRSAIHILKGLDGKAPTNKHLNPYD
jgi:hypothetical protein